MSNSRIENLTSLSVMSSDDLLVAVDSPASSPVTKQITRANFMGGTNVVQVVGTTETQTLTNKTIDSASNTLTGVVTLTGSQTLTNKTITAPTISAPTFSGTASGSLTSLTLVTPALGTPASGVATNLTGTASGLTAGAVTGLTLASGSITLSGGHGITLTTTGTTSVTLPTSGTLATLAGTETLTNKRVNKRTDTVASSATPTINTDTTDIFTITALATAITSMTTNLSGTPVNGQTLVIRILDNGTARAITWGSSFASRGATLPTTTVLSKYLYAGFIYNSTAAVWDCVAVAQEV